MSHHPECPALFFTDHPERCRCVFLVMLDAPLPDEPATETSPLFDELAIERLREGLARWGEEE